MVGNADGCAFAVGRQQVAQMAWTGGRQAQLLVEIAIVQPTLPIDADQIAAHDVLKVGVLIVVLQQPQVVGELPFRDQRRAEAVDGHVGQRKQGVESYAELPGEFAFVVRFELCLRGRQAGALGVVDQVEQQTGTLAAVTQRIEFLQRPDAFFEHALAALAVDVVGGITGQRRHHLHALGGKKLRQAFLSGLEQDSQIAAVDDVHAKAPRLTYQIAKLRMQFRRAAGEVERPDPARRQHPGNQRQGNGIHHLGAGGAGVDVAVQAALVAAVAEIDLEGAGGTALERGEIGHFQQGQGGAHGVLSTNGLPGNAVGRPVSGILTRDG